MTDRFPIADPIDDRLLRPGTPGYDRARQVWNGMIDRRPAAILACRSVAEVQAGVRWAAGQGLPVSIKAGGHNVAGHAVGADSLMLDLSGLRAVQVDPDLRLAWVEGGALWADVDAATQAHGLATPGGLISETGVAGLTLSGGIGWLRAAHGLAVDNLVAAEVVTAAGDLVRADAEHNPDLLWALKGGGGNFGVVVRFCFALHPFGPEVMFCGPVYPVSEGAAPLRFWRDYVTAHSDRLGSLAEFSTIPDSADFPAEFRGQRCYTLLAVPNCDADTGEALVAPLRDLGRKAADFSGRMTYVEAQRMFDPLFPAGAFRCYWKSHLLTRLTDGMIDEALANAVANPSDSSISSLWNFGGATARVPAEATAFGDRSFGWMYSLDSVWERPEDDDRVRGWTRAAWDRYRRHAHEGRLYLNFAGQDEDSAALTRDAHGRNYARLARIKADWDPANLFRFNQNILPATEEVPPLLPDRTEAGYSDPEEMAIVWGDGFMSPGGREEVARVLGGHRLDGLRVLDVGSGMGGAAMALVEDHGAAHVTGLDVQADLVAKAQAKVVTHGLTGRIDFRLASPGPLPFGDASFDVLFTKDAMIHVADKSAMLAEFHRVLRPGGLMFFADWLRGDGARYDGALALLFGETQHDFRPCSLQTITRLARAAGFEILETEDRRDWYAAEARRERARIEGELRPTYLARGGEAELEGQLRFWTLLVAALDEGALRPGHLRARKR